MFGSLKALRRVRELEEAFEKLSRDFKHLELEWLDTLDRIKRLMGRISKRAEVDSRPESGSDGSNTAEVGVTPEPTMDPISAKIWARRRHLADRSTP